MAHAFAQAGLDQAEVTELAEPGGAPFAHFRLLIA